MILHVLRHGIAEDVSPAGDDASRALTPRGRQKMAQAARGMRAMGLAFDVVWTSPLVRAVETTAIVVDAYDGAPSPEQVDALKAGVPPADTLRALQRVAGTASVLVVGHEPGLSGLVSLVLSGSANAVALVLKKGGLVVVELPETRARSATMRGALRCMLTPRQLRRLGR